MKKEGVKGQMNNKMKIHVTWGETEDDWNREGKRKGGEERGRREKRKKEGNWNIVSRVSKCKIQNFTMDYYCFRTLRLKILILS